MINFVSIYIRLIWKSNVIYNNLSSFWCYSIFSKLSSKNGSDFLNKKFQSPPIRYNNLKLYINHVVIFYSVLVFSLFFDALYKVIFAFIFCFVHHNRTWRHAKIYNDSNTITAINWTCKQLWLIRRIHFARFR